VRWERSPETEFEVLVTKINPVRLEPLPLVLSPVATAPPPRPKWSMVGVAVCAGAIVGTLIASLERKESSASVAQASAPSAASAAPSPESTPATIERPELIEISETEAIDVSRPETIEMPPAPMRATAPIAPRSDRSTICGPSAASVWSAPEMLDLDVTDALHDAPEVQPRDEQLPIAIERTMIRSAISAVRPAVKHCGELYPGRGTVKLFMYVRANGAVESVTVTATPALLLGQCVASAVAKARFAPTLKGGALKYPFRF
jgi:hypothetical protein